MGPRKQYRRIFVPGFVAAAGALVIGMLFLLSDMGRPSAIELLVLAPVFGYLNIGAWSLAAATAACIGLAAFWFSPSHACAGAKLVALRIATCITFAIGLVVALYTGLFLAAMKAVPLWHVGRSCLTPTLFLASSLSCGVAVFNAMLHLSGEDAVFRPLCRLLAKADLALLAVEALAAMALLVLAANISATPTGQAAAVGAAALISGAQSSLWWGGFVGAGLLLAAVCDFALARQTVARKRSRILRDTMIPARRTTAVVLMVAVCIGAFSIRAALVMAGVHPAISIL